MLLCAAPSGFARGFRRYSSAFCMPTWPYVCILHVPCLDWKISEQDVRAIRKPWSAESVVHATHCRLNHAGVSRAYSIAVRYTSRSLDSRGNVIHELIRTSRGVKNLWQLWQLYLTLPHMHKLSASRLLTS